jgi:4-amino-4-deoxy-L-arabinose transferase-like glycosyltransferase
MSEEYSIFASDDKLYALAGWHYIHGASPDTINFEHPPLAKYMIGLSELLFMNPVLLGFIFSVFTLILVYIISRNLVTASLIAILPSVLLSLDKMYIQFSTLSMLDIYATFFAVLSLLLLTSKKEWIMPLLGVTMGLAISCKWTSAFLLVLPVLYYAVRHDLRGLKLYPLCIFLAALTYTASYAGFFYAGHGLHDFLDLQLKMLSFHQQRHLVASGIKPLRILLVFLTGIEGPTQIQTLLINSDTKTVTTLGSGSGISLCWAYNPLTWPISFSASILALYYSVRRDRDMMPLPLAFLLLLSSSASLGEPFIWYLLPGLPLAFISLTYMVNKTHADSTNKTVASAIIFSYVVLIVVWSLFVRLPPYLEMSKTS